MMDMKALRTGGALLALVLAASAAAQASDEAVSMAKVTGWIGKPADVPVYTHGGTPAGRADPGATPMSGVRQWNRSYNLVKLNSDPRDDRWVPAKYLNIVFCEQASLSRAMPVGGQREDNKAITQGSGRSCGQ